jgi:predicted lipoprotein with Yx(FWY)xxD motif
MTVWIGARSVALAAVITVGVGAASASAVSSIPTVRDAPTGALGSIVVGSTGLTLSHLTSEKKGSVGCTGACAKQWPPLLVSSHATFVGGAGLLRAKLGTIQRPDGGLQVTYGGFALYRFAGDSKAGQANGQGAGGTW